MGARLGFRTARIQTPAQSATHRSGSRKQPSPGVHCSAPSTGTCMYRQRNRCCAGRQEAGATCWVGCCEVRGAFPPRWPCYECRDCWRVGAEHHGPDGPPINGDGARLHPRWLCSAKTAPGCRSGRAARHPLSGNPVYRPLPEKPRRKASARSTCTSHSRVTGFHDRQEGTRDWLSVGNQSIRFGRSLFFLFY
jgi:hypothetical protein